MIRTQLYLPEKVHKALMQLAHQKSQPMAVIVRSFIKKGLSREKGIDHSGKTVLSNLLNIQATGGSSDLSSHIDHYLYGTPKKP